MELWVLSGELVSPRPAVKKKGFWHGAGCGSNKRMLALAPPTHLAPGHFEIRELLGYTTLSLSMPKSMYLLQPRSVTRAVSCINIRQKPEGLNIYRIVYRYANEI